MKLIDKDSIVAEIKKRRKEWQYGNSVEAKYKKEECDDILSLFDTLKVKDVNLDDYYHSFLQKEWFENANHVRTVSEMMAFIAKHFFELGLKAQKGE